MTPRRLLAVLLFFFVTAFAVAHLQTQQVRTAGRIACLNRQILQLSYQQWHEQTQMARLCAPAELLDRTSQMALGTVAPKAIFTADTSTSSAAGQMASSR